jgi:hypothetical protein
MFKLNKLTCLSVEAFYHNLLIPRVEEGNANLKGGFSTVDLHIKVAYL